MAVRMCRIHAAWTLPALSPPVSVAGICLQTEAGLLIKQPRTCVTSVET